VLKCGRESIKGGGKGERASVVLRPFYRRQPCGDGEGKWGGGGEGCHAAM
jgi:hypothetical protein